MADSDFDSVEITEDLTQFPLCDEEELFDEPSETGPLIRPFGPPEGDPIPTLRVAAGPELMRFAAVRPDAQLLIGRHPEAQLQLGDATVSARHARLTSDGAGNLMLIDLGSKNGTAINGDRISRTVVMPGDHIEVGRVSLALELVYQNELEFLSEMQARRGREDCCSRTGLYGSAWLKDPIEREVYDDPMLTVAGVQVTQLGKHQATVLRAAGSLVLHNVGAGRPVIKLSDDRFLCFIPQMGEAKSFYLMNGVRRAVVHHEWRRTAENLHPNMKGVVMQRLPDETTGGLVERVTETLANMEGSQKIRMSSQT